MKKMTLVDWTILSLGGLYGFGWSLVIYVTHSGGNEYYSRWILNAKNIYFLHTTLVFLLVFFIYFGWLLASSFFVKIKKNTFPPLVGRNDQRYYLMILAWLLLIIAMSTQVLCVRAFGGFIATLDYSLAIRAGIIEVNNPWSFLRPFSGLIFVSSYVFFGLILDRYRRYWAILGFFISTSFSFYELFSRVGRVDFLVYIVTFVLGVILYLNPRPQRLLLYGLASLSSIILGAYQISNIFNIKSRSGFIDFVVHEISFPFTNFFLYFQSTPLEIRWFKDLMFFPLYILPQKIWLNFVDNVSQVNTTLYFGAPKGVDGVTSGMPVDLLTLGMYQFPFVGLMVLGSLFGILLYLLENTLEQISSNGVRSILYALVVLKVSVLGVFYSHPAVVVKGNFELIVAILLLFLLSRLPRLTL